MARIKFDVTGNPVSPTFILAKRSGEKIGLLPASSINLIDELTNPTTAMFDVYKYYNDVLCPIWDEIIDFRLVWCEEWMQWFQLSVSVDESTETVKRVSLTSLYEAELSQLSLNDIEINAENDIDRDDYVVSRLWDGTENSIISRILKDKAAHYTVKHVDSTIAGIQRMFTFDSTTIYDAFVDIAQEIGCIFVYGETNESNLDSARIKPVRTISIYDMQSNCLNPDCSYRGEFTGVCPECGSTDIDEGYGLDTTIFVAADSLANNITFTTDVDQVKNCFRLVSGDDDMDAAIRSVNPSGTNYIWYFSDETKKDMSTELSQKLDIYTSVYNFIKNEWDFDVSVDAYNALVNKYHAWNTDLIIAPSPVVGYSALNQIMYSAIDFQLYLQTGMMPDASLSETNAETEARKLTSASLSPVSVNNISNLSDSSTENAVTGMAKTLIDPRYKIEILSQSLNGTTWTGTLKITNLVDQDDTSNTSSLTITINDDYENFVKQKVEKALTRENTDDVSIVGIFKMELSDFKREIKKYSLDALKRFYNSAEGALGIMQEQGFAAQDSIGYDLYQDYFDKQAEISTEINVRDGELDVINEILDSIDRERAGALNQLNLERFLGDYWTEFCSFRRDGEYNNENYISDGLTNSEIFENAEQFLKVARDEIYKSAELQHSISATLNNLLMMPEFRPLLSYFSVGNWLRIRVDDRPYKLRLIQYNIDFDNITTLSVEFSDLTKIASGVSDLKSILDKTQKMGTEFISVARQANKSEKATQQIDSWFKEGLDLTNINILNSAESQTQTWTSNGALFRKWDDITETYEPEQMKIVNSTLAITKDKWQTVDTAIGKVYYVDPIDNEVHETYGVNAKTVVGDLIVGGSLRLRNTDNSLLFDSNGLSVMSDNTTLNIAPSSDYVQRITHDGTDVFYVNKQGEAFLRGGIVAGNNNEVQINPDGTFDFGNGRLVFDGSSLAIGGYPTTGEMNSAIQNAIAGNTLVISLSKQYYPVFTNPDGSIDVFPTIMVFVSVYHDGVDVTENATITVSPNGCDGTYNSTSYMYRVTSMSSNDATVTFNATYNGASASALFSLSKVSSGSDNTSFSYEIETDVDAIFRKVSNVFSPKTISIKGYVVAGDTKEILTNDYYVSSYYALGDELYSARSTSNPDTMSRISFSLDLGSAYYTYNSKKYLKQSLIIELYKVGTDGDNDLLLVKKTIPISMDANAILVQDALDNDQTYINGAMIATGTISADQIDVENLFSKTIVASGKIVSPRLVTSDYTYTTGNANYFADSGFIVDLQQGVIRSEVFAVTTSGNPYFCQTIHVCDKRDKAKVIATLGSNGIRVDDVVQIGSDSATFQGNITAQGHNSPIGTVVNATGEGSLVSGTGTMLAQYRFPTGTWIVTFTVAYPSGTGNGTKRISISTSSSGAVNLTPSTTVAHGSVRDSERKIMQKTRCISVESSTTYYFSAYQNSGQVENVTYSYEIVRIA